MEGVRTGGKAEWQGGDRQSTKEGLECPGGQGAGAEQFLSVKEKGRCGRRKTEKG